MGSLAYSTKSNDNRTGSVAVHEVSKVIVSNISKKVLIEKCSFVIEPKKFTVIVGQSGCGKTTLINLIAGYDRPTSGSVTLKGKSINGPGPDRLVVFQETALFPWMTALENVAYGPQVQRTRSHSEIKTEAMRLLAKVGLAGFSSKYPTQLSGGMQRRVELARALINKPEILLMDEPFRGLDAMTRELMQEYLLALFEERRDTILFVTSEIDEAIFLADRLIILSASPARVKSVIDVDFPRPRERHRIFSSDRYAEIKKTALDILYEKIVGYDSRETIN